MKFKDYSLNFKLYVFNFELESLNFQLYCLNIQLESLKIQLYCLNCQLLSLNFELWSFILIHYVCNTHFHWLWRRKLTVLKSKRLCHESRDDVTSLATRRSNITKTFWKCVLSEWIGMAITRFVFQWFAGKYCIILRLQIPVLPLRWTRRGKTKFATVKWHNLCLQVIQSKVCYPLIYQLHSLNFKLHSLNFQPYSLNFKLHF